MDTAVSPGSVHGAARLPEECSGRAVSAAVRAAHPGVAVSGWLRSPVALPRPAPSRFVLSPEHPTAPPLERGGHVAACV